MCRPNVWQELLRKAALTTVPGPALLSLTATAVPTGFVLCAVLQQPAGWSGRRAPASRRFLCASGAFRVSWRADCRASAARPPTRALRGPVFASALVLLPLCGASPLPASAGWVRAASAPAKPVRAGGPATLGLPTWSHGPVAGPPPPVWLSPLGRVDAVCRPKP